MENALARALVQQDARVVLVDLALESPNLAVLSTNPDAPGIADLVRGDASFGEIVTRDRFSRGHLVATGRMEGVDPAMLSSPRLAMTLEALARTYDHVIVDGGSVTETMAPSFAKLTPRAVLVATDLEHPAAQAARDRLIAAGFIEVTIRADIKRPKSTIRAIGDQVLEQDQPRTMARVIARGV